MRARGRDLFKTLPRGAKTLWIAALGGHLAESVHIDHVIRSHPDSVWVTFDAPQSRSMLRDRRVHFVDYVAPRDIRAAAKAARDVAALVEAERFDACISTGAAVAGFSVPWVASRNIPTFYVESLARLNGPSMTGRMMRIAPRVRTLTQHEAWSGRHWQHHGSILDGFSALEDARTPTGARKVLVTLGTIRPYRFDRAVDAVLRSVRPGDEITWQLGSTTRIDLPGRVYVDLRYDELEHQIGRADVVVCHAGAGSVVQAHSHGKLPVLAVRSAAFGEHVDNHQAQLASWLVERGLAVLLDLDGGNYEALDRAARSVVRTTQGAPAQLRGGTNTE